MTLSPTDVQRPEISEVVERVLHSPLMSVLVLRTSHKPLSLFCLFLFSLFRLLDTKNSMMISKRQLLFLILYRFPSMTSTSIPRLLSLYSTRQSSIRFSPTYPHKLLSSFFYAIFRLHSCFSFEISLSENNYTFIKNMFLHRIQEEKFQSVACIRVTDITKIRIVWTMPITAQYHVLTACKILYF